jgi:AAA+ superfamily predicted ATPase
MSWISELTLKIRARATNVFILVTSDFDRITQLLNTIPTEIFSYKVEGKTVNRIPAILDVNLNKLYKDNSEQPVTQLTQLLQDMPRWLSDHPGTFLVIHYVWSEHQAQSLTPQLISTAQNSMVYGSNSVVAVFTVSEFLFPTPLLKFCHVINIPVSTDEERQAKLREIVNAIVTARPELAEQLKITDEIIVASKGLTLKETESATLESIFKHRTLKKEVFTEYKQGLFAKYGLTLTYPSTTFDHVGGYNYLKEYFKNRLKKAIASPETLRFYGLEPPRGIIMYGPPGTGKSFLASALAAEIGIPMVKLSPADFLRGIVGESEARVRQIVNLLESLSPVIVFIDEFESMGMARGIQAVTDSGVSRRVQNMLLEWLGDRNRTSFVVGATNFIEQVDPAFIRPGRIDEVVPMLYPDYEARLEILQIHTSKIRKIPLKDVNLSEIASKTSLWTGAELEKLCITSAQLALDQDSKNVTVDHFEEALRALSIDILERENNLKRMIENLKKMENVNQIILSKALQVLRKEPRDRLAQIAKEI